MTAVVAPAPVTRPLELLARRPPEDVGRALLEEAPVVYRENGNRSVGAEEMLARVVPLLPRVGVTRVAELSALSTFPYPVYQAVRPNIFFHRKMGQNTGAQGKGSTVAQARLSAIMEAIEAYCAEPKLPMPLVRGSFAAIRGHHAAIDPRRLQTYTHLAPPDLDEPLVWTDAYCPDLDAPVLVPAEVVFFPFLPHDYETRSLFPSGTNGLASGATYLDAVVHGVYEVVERHLLREVLKGLLLLERLHLDGVLDLAELATAATDYRVRVYAARPSSARALPFLACVVTEPATGRSFAGYGCAGSVDVALSRAVSEAWQSAATVASGAREDATHKHGGEDALALPEAQTLRIAEYRRAVVDESFDSVRAEHDFLRRWLAAAGHGPLLVANLTRVGVEVPVVKVLVPGATWAAADRAPESLARGPTSTDVARVRHGVRRRALDGGSEP